MHKIFSTHDVWLLDVGILRRDEIWFIEKNGDGISELYSLMEFKGYNNVTIRNNVNLLKNYILGNYGGIPNLQSFPSFLV